MGWFFSSNNSNKDREDTREMSRAERREYERKMKEAEKEREWDILMMCEVMADD